VIGTEVTFLKATPFSWLFAWLVLVVVLVLPFATVIAPSIHARQAGRYPVLARDLDVDLEQVEARTAWFFFPWANPGMVQPRSRRLGSFAGATFPHMAHRERKLLELAVHTVAEQAAKADAR